MALPFAEIPSDRYSPGPPWIRIIIPSIVTILAFVAFWPALQAQFINYDDIANIADNPYIRGFGPDNLRWMFTTTMLGNYQPIVWLSWALDYQIGGLNPAVYHRHNLILHALNS